MISDPALWQRARQHFDELVDMEHGAQHARLEEIGRRDAELRAAVQGLLVADRDAERALRDYEFGTPGEKAARPQASGDPLGVIGQTVSHFRVTEFLAAGGMGVVYRAEDLQLQRTVALKFPLPNQEVGRGVQERFVNEARSAAALDHRNLCTVFETGESDHGVFLAMPLYPGETLKERLARDGALEPGTALDIAVQVTSGVAAAHVTGIVHRDLKPGNVMLLPDGTAKVLDFGLAKIRDVDLTKSVRTLGTIGYVAPEQVRGAAVDARTDLWAIGVMLYEMLTGAMPFPGDHEMAVMHAVLHAEPPPPSSVNTHLSAPFDDLVGALMQKDPADRYQSADALLVDLGALQRGASFTPPTPFWRRTVKRRRIRRAVVPALGLVLFVAGVAWAIGAQRAANARADLVGGAAPALRWTGNTTEVGDVPALVAALVPANAGRTVRMRPGTYDIEQPLVVPDGMTLEGAGVMRFTPDGLPEGFADETRSVIRMTANTAGDVITLGNGATLRNVEVLDLHGRAGNVVAVISRAPRDSVSADIADVVIVNPNVHAISPSGPSGRGLLMLTLNPNMGADPAPHDGAVLSLRVVRSVVRSPAGGGGFFAYNFAANGRISLDIARSVIGGSSEANGGVSRPDSVHDSQVRVTSELNLYRNEWKDPCVKPELGWNLTGGSGAPIPIALPATTGNRLYFRSVNDRIEAFTTAVLATGSRRFFAAPLNGASIDNHIDLQLIGTAITTPTCAVTGRSENTSGVPLVRASRVADLRLYGAHVENDAIEAGDGNTVRVELRGVTGSGKRANQYVNAGGSPGELPARLRGRGNRLEIVGDPASFPQLNRAIDPAPPAAFFPGIRVPR